MVRDEERQTVLRYLLSKNPITRGYSALMLEKAKVGIVMSDHKAVLRLMIENGVDVTVKDKFGRTSLHHATQSSMGLEGWFSYYSRKESTLVHEIIAG
jgi:hypothetical protein